MSHITIKASELLGAIEIARLDQKEKRKTVMAHLEELFDAAERGGHWKHNRKMLDRHSLKVAKYRDVLDLLEGMTKLTPDGMIALGDEHFKTMKPFIRTL